MIFNTKNQLTSLNELYVGEAKEDYVSEAIMAAALALIIRGGMEVFSGDSAEVEEIAGGKQNQEGIGICWRAMLINWPNLNQIWVIDYVLQKKMKLHMSCFPIHLCLIQ